MRRYHYVYLGALVTYFICSPAIASVGGIDFSGNSAMISWQDWHRNDWEKFYNEYKLPVFKTKEEANDWAHKVKWIEPIRRKVYREIRELRDIAYLNSHKLTVTSIQTAGDIMQLVDYYEFALFQIKQYKERKEAGDFSQVGASMYAGSYPI